MIKCRFFLEVLDLKNGYLVARFQFDDELPFAPTKGTAIEFSANAFFVIGKPSWSPQERIAYWFLRPIEENSFECNGLPELTEYLKTLGFKLIEG